MEDYTANSRLSKEKSEESTERKVEKVVSGNVKQKKKSGLSKFAGAVVQEDAHNVAYSLFSDVLIPALKKTIQDLVTNGIDMLLYGDSGRSKKSPGSKISYNSIYDRGSTPVRRNRNYDYDYDEIIIDNRGEAEEVLSALDEIIDQYKAATVLDFYDLVGVTGKHTDQKFGWTDLRSAQVVRVREGYVIKLPKPVALN